MPKETSFFEPIENGDELIQPQNIDYSEGSGDAELDKILLDQLKSERDM